MSTRAIERQRRQVATHEAGHAVAAWLLRIRLPAWVSIVPKRNELGHVTTWRQDADAKHFRRLPDLFQGELSKARAAHKAIFSYAGGIAERYAFPDLSDDHFTYSCINDFAQADKLVHDVYGCTLGAELWRNLLEWKTRRLVKKNWHLIEALATALAQRRSLTGRAAEAILKTADEEYLLSGDDDGYELLK